MERFQTKPSAEELARRHDFHVRLAQFASVEKRSSLSNWEAWNAMFPEFSIASINSSVSVSSAQKLSIVFTCLNVLGETVGSLPFDVKQYTDKGRVTVPEHPVYRLIHDRPNHATTAFDFWSTAQKLKKAFGNCYVEIKRDRNMIPTELWFLPPSEVYCKVTLEGDHYYTFRDKTFPATDILHFKNYSMDGFTGLSTIRQNAMTIGQGLKLKEYNSNIITNRPPGFLTSEAPPRSPQAKQNMRNMVTGEKDPVTGGPNLDKVSAGTLGHIPIFYGGVKYVPIMLPADDVAYIESTNLTNKDIYGMFRVPPTFGQDWENTPYNGAEQQDIVFAKYTLADLRATEQEVTEKLFTESNKKAKNAYYGKFNLKGLLAGDSTTRQKFYTALFNIGCVSPNEIREMEDMVAYEGGDQRFVQGALVPIDKIAEMIDANIKSASQPKQAPKDAKQLRDEIMEEVEAEMKARLNGHFKDVEEYFA